MDTACTLTTGASGTAMVVGDSHAATYAPMLTDLARRHDLTLYGGLLSFCPWTRGIRYQSAGTNCFSDQDRLFDQILTDLDPDIVFLAHRPVDDPNGPLDIVDVEEGPLRSGAVQDALTRRIDAVVQDLLADGRTVVIFEPVPVAPPDLNPRVCLEQEDAAEPCRFVTSRGGVAEDEIIGLLDQREEGVVALDLDRLTCPYLPICDPMVGGEVVRRDDNHLTIAFTRTLLDPIEAVLEAEGVFD